MIQSPCDIEFIFSRHVQNKEKLFLPSRRQVRNSFLNSAEFMT